MSAAPRVEGGRWNVEATGVMSVLLIAQGIDLCKLEGGT